LQVIKFLEIRTGGRKNIAPIESSTGLSRTKSYQEIASDTHNIKDTLLRSMTIGTAIMPKTCLCLKTATCFYLNFIRGGDDKKHIIKEAKMQ
jgi:hypothetical protein